MQRGTGDRGVSEVIGFILVFGMLVTAFTVYQGIVVPDQNRQVEFEHNQQVQGQFQELRNGLLTTAATGARQSASIKLGADYPRRTIARNLGVSGGAIQAISPDGTGEIRIENATATGPYGETDDVWNGTPQDFDTETITYRPVYSFYSNAPVTHLDNGLVFNRFDGANTTVTDQALVDGNRITLLSLAGDLSNSGDGTTTVELEAASAATNRIAIRNDTAPITITIPTHLNAADWNETLWDEHAANPDVADGRVTDVRDGGPGQVEIVLQRGVTYDLRLARVNVGGEVDPEPARYLALVDRPDETIANGSSHFVTVEARDRFNNPVTGEAVNATIDGDGTFADGSMEKTLDTSADGRATVTYQAPSSPGDVTLSFEIGDGSSAAEVVEVDLDVVSGVGGGDGGEGSSNVNPSTEQKTLVYVNSTIVKSNEGTATLFLNNTGGSTIDIERVRFQFYSFTQSSETQPPDSVWFGGSGNNVPYLGPFEPLTGTSISPGVQSIDLTFREPSGAYTVEDGDFAIFTVETSDDETITYFIGLTS